MEENTISQVGDVFNNLGQWGIVGIILAVIASMLLVVFAVLGSVTIFMKGGFIDSTRSLIHQVAELNTRSTNLQAVTDKQEEAIDRHSDILIDHEGRIHTLEESEKPRKREHKQ